MKRGLGSPPSNNYADPAARHRGNGVSFSRGKRYRDERRRRGSRRRRRNAEGGWNGNGRGLVPEGRESVPRRSKQPSGDASVTELTLPCAFVRKRGLPDSRFLRITHAATYTCARTPARARDTIAFLTVPLSTYRRAHRAVRFPPSWPPRGPSLSTSVIQPWEQLHAPFSTVPFPRCFFPSCSCVRSLRILIRKLSL